MSFLYGNNCVAKVVDAIGYSDTTITVEEVGRFPSNQFSRTRPMLATTTHKDEPGAFEIVALIGTDEGAADPAKAFLVERGFEDTYPRGWPAGATLSARVTAGMLDSFATKSTGGYFRPAGFELESESFGIVGNPAIRRNFPTLLDSPTYDWHRAGNSLAVCGASVFVDLGVPRVWGAGANYRHGDVVQPPVANGYQYWASTNASYIGNPEADFSNPGDVVPFIGRTGQQHGAWMPMATPLDFSARLEMDSGVFLAVDEVGFIVSNANASTVPTVSIGSARMSNSPDKTRFANAVALSQIDPSEGMQVHRIPVTTGGKVDALRS